MFRRTLFSILALALCGAALAQTAPSVDDLVARNTAARGGADKIKAVQSVKITGKAVMMNGMEAPLTIYIKRPGKTRMEMNIQGKAFVQAFDGTDSWTINPFTGSGEPEKAPEEDSKRARENANTMMDGYLVDYKTKGITIEMMGKEDVGGTPAYKLKLTTKSGNVLYDWLDAQTYLDLKTSGKVKQAGQEVEVESFPSNYKEVAGLMTPHSLEQKVNGQSLMKMDFDKVEVNVPMDESLFKFAAKAGEKPAEKKQ